MEEFTHYFNNFNKITEQLEKKYKNNNILEIQQIIEILQENPSINEIKKSINELQKINDILFEKYGISDEIIEFQVCINKIRNYKDIPDEKEIITHDDGEFVQ